MLLDTVGGVHLLAARPELARLATISLSANFIGPVRPGRVLATAQIQRIGGAVGYTAMAPHAGDFEGELLATAHGAYRLFHAGAGRALCLSAGPAPQSNDVDADTRGLIYVIDQLAGFAILEVDGAR